MNQVMSNPAAEAARPAGAGLGEPGLLKMPGKKDRYC